MDPGQQVRELPAPDPPGEVVRLGRGGEHLTSCHHSGLVAKEAKDVPMHSGIVRAARPPHQMRGAGLCTTGWKLSCV